MCYSLCFGLQESSIKRQTRTLEAANHVGVAIVSSAVTTAISTIPLFFCVIVPFAKFGQIVAINTAISIAFTLTVTTALLATMGPSDFTRPPGAVLKATLGVLIVGVCGGLLWWTGSQFAPDTLIWIQEAGGFQESNCDYLRRHVWTLWEAGLGKWSI